VGNLHLLGLPVEGNKLVWTADFFGLDQGALVSSWQWILVGVVAIIPKLIPQIQGDSLAVMLLRGWRVLD